MSIRVLLAASVMAAGLAFAPQAAEAKTTINIGIGLGGGWCYKHPFAPGCGFGYKPYYQPYHPHMMHYYDGYGDDDGYGGWNNHGKLSCGDGRAVLRNRGFHDISALECSGRSYTYRAIRNGHHFVLRVNAWNGGVATLSKR